MLLIAFFFRRAKPYPFIRSYNHSSVRAVCCAYAQRLSVAHWIDVKLHWCIRLLLLLYHFTISSWPYNAQRMQLMATLFFSFLSTSFFLFPLRFKYFLHITAFSLNLFNQIWVFLFRINFMYFELLLMSLALFFFLLPNPDHLVE